MFLHRVVLATWWTGRGMESEMPGNQYDVNPAAVSADAKSWDEVSSQLSTLSGKESEVHLDGDQLSFASHAALAPAYVAVVQRFQELTQEGSEEARHIGDALTQVRTAYGTTDSSSAQNLSSSGQGMP